MTARTEQVRPSAPAGTTPVPLTSQTLTSPTSGPRDRAERPSRRRTTRTGRRGTTTDHR